MQHQPDFMITAGGDGTILDAVTYVRDSGIPMLGINTGRLGFLSNVSKEKISKAIHDLAEGNYTLDERNLLNLSYKGLDIDLNFALNEISVSPQGYHRYGDRAHLDKRSLPE